MMLYLPHRFVIIALLCVLGFCAFMGTPTWEQVDGCDVELVNIVTAVGWVKSAVLWAPIAIFIWFIVFVGRGDKSLKEYLVAFAVTIPFLFFLRFCAGALLTASTFPFLISQYSMCVGTSEGVYDWTLYSTLTLATILFLLAPAIFEGILFMILAKSRLRALGHVVDVSVNYLIDGYAKDYRGDEIEEERALKRQMGDKYVPRAERERLARKQAQEKQE